MESLLFKFYIAKLAHAGLLEESVGDQVIKTYLSSISDNDGIPENDKNAA